jgi:hypothetical protein
MKPPLFAYLVFAVVLALLALFIADREWKASVERLSDYKFGPRSELLEAARNRRQVNSSAPAGVNFT